MKNFGYIWELLGTFENIYKIRENLGKFWVILEIFWDYFGKILGKFRAIWKFLGIFMDILGKISDIWELVGTFWGNSRKSQRLNLPSV